MTPAEAAVIRSLLADEPVPHRVRIQRSGLPPRTYEVARQRLLAAGWVVERYVPDPIRLGRPIVRVRLLRPFAERRSTVADAWRDDPTTVFLWEAPQLLLSVSMVPDRGATGGGALRASDGRGVQLDADLRRPSVPVYFDFEGLWSRLSEAPGTFRYPRSLAPGGSGADPPPAPSAREREAWEQLVLRPLAPGSTAGRGWFGGRHVRRALATGALEHRFFLDVTAVPSYRERRIGSVVLLNGTLRTGARPERLFRSLVGSSRVLPFLFVSDGTRLLLGAAAPAPPGDVPRAPVLPILSESLEAIEVDRVPVAELRTTVAHRYDRLFDGAVG